MAERMGKFAWSNLLTRPLRTILALIGLSVPILGVLGLFSVSAGLRSLVGDTLEKIKGVMVLRENVPTPVFSSLPVAVGETIRSMPGVRAVAPEVWGLPPTIEDVSLIPRNPLEFLNRTREQKIQSFLDATIIQGQDIVAHQGLKSAVYPNALKEGRFLLPEDAGSRNIVISRKIAAEHKNPDGTAKQVGQQLKIGSEPYTIIGLYETGSMLLDPVIVMDIGTARKLLGKGDGEVSSFYVEGDDPGRIDELALKIEEALPEPRVDARSMSEFAANFGTIMGQIDTFLMMTVSLALLVGVVGIINTMLMSTTERFVEFGVLRTNGWSRSNVLGLVTLESAYLGLLAGALGCLMALAMTQVANQFLSGGLQLQFTPGLVATGLLLSVVMGTLGGLYPAWKASRLVPMDAIRLGSR
ncbi:ABC transporter permease [Tundrisphaera sp. TA3]|uniref:ABC transporter permease n=1 Tax=Tundrisphaera sp. TA3 TaxID=3435775 RepID=UPI003EBA9ECD